MLASWWRYITRYPLSHEDISYLELECLHQVSWQSVQKLLKHFTKKHKCESHDEEKKKSEDHQSRKLHPLEITGVYISIYINFIHKKNLGNASKVLTYFR